MGESRELVDVRRLLNVRFWIGSGRSESGFDDQLPIKAKMFAYGHKPPITPTMTNSHARRSSTSGVTLIVEQVILDWRVVRHEFVYVILKPGAKPVTPVAKPLPDSRISCRFC